MEWIFLKYSLLFFTIIFFDLEEIIFENVNISENNIIKQGTRVCKYIYTHMHTLLCTLPTWPAYHEGMWCKDWWCLIVSGPLLIN